MSPAGAQSKLRPRLLLHVSNQRREWDVESLAPLLTDRRPDRGWMYGVDPGPNGPRLPIRVCDEAAGVISGDHPGLPFRLAGTHEDLDRQIAAMRERISR